MGHSAGIQEHDKVNVARAISVGAASPVAGAAMLATMGGKKLLNKPPVHHSLSDLGHLIGKKLSDTAQAIPVEKR